VKSANNPVLANKINQVCIFPNKKSQLQIAAGIVHFRKNYLLIVIDMGTQLRYDAILGLKTSNPFDVICDDPGDILGVSSDD